MNKTIRIAALCLAASVMFSAAACRPQETAETSDTASASAESSVTKAVTSKPDETSETTAESTAPKKEGAIEFKPRDQRYHYDMELKFDTAAKTIGGHVVFDFYNDSEEAWDKLCLRDYSSLYKDPENVGYDAGVKTNGAVTEISNIIDGRNNAAIEMTRDQAVSVVWLPLASALNPGEKMTLSYDFVAAIPSVADRYGYQDGVYNVTNFYPILAEYTKDGWSHERFYSAGECFFSEISDYDVRLTVPEEMVILSTGLEKGETKDSGSKTITIHADCVRDFVFCGSEDFVTVEGDYEDTHIRVAYTEEDHPAEYKRMADESLRASVESLKAFNSAFGIYPYEDLEVILAPIDAGGMEYPNLVIICKDYPVDSSEEDIESYIVSRVETVVSHEIGHQWFMGIVGSNSGLQPWLDESFASYTEYVYSCSAHPDWNDDLRRVANFDDYESDEEFRRSMAETGYVPINRSFYDFPNRSVYTAGVYFFGKEMMIDMEDALGREEFYKIIRDYVKQYAFKNADQTDFFKVLYEHAGTDNKKLNSVTYRYLDDIGQPPAA